MIYEIDDYQLNNIKQKIDTLYFQKFIFNENDVKKAYQSIKKTINAIEKTAQEQKNKYINDITSEYITIEQICDKYKICRYTFYLKMNSYNKKLDKKFIGKKTYFRRENIEKMFNGYEKYDSKRKSKKN